MTQQATEIPTTHRVLSPETAQALELPSLLAVLAELAATDLGREQILALSPLPDVESLEAARRSFEEARGLVTERRLVPSFDLPLAGLLERLESGRPPVTGPDLLGLASLLQAVREATDRVRQAEPPCPELAAETEDLQDLSELERKIGSLLDRRGEVRENATPKLAALRSRVRKLRDHLYEDLGGYLQQHRDTLSEDTVPLRGGRLVVVLPAGARGKLPGLIHGRSGTGKSFYFEPLEVVEANNSLQQSVEDESAERQRIFRELLEAARAQLPAIRHGARLLARLDLLQAMSRFADRVGGRLAELSGRHELKLVGARHPLLDPALGDLRETALGQRGHSQPVVPLEIELSPQSRALIVTGPNAGGKTVALKTVGLLTLAHQCGLPIPAEAGSRLPRTQRLVATVGDEQDLLADRSTFSGRLLRLKEAWEAAGPESLLLLDELGSGTDPEEGAALAVSLLEGLTARGSLAVITTHLTQLASVALELPGAACAAMEFDGESGHPTFRLLPGPPGGSEALALARRLGLPGEWLDRAEEKLGSEHRQLRRLLSEVEELRRKLSLERGHLERQRMEVDAELARLGMERTALESERKETKLRLKGELEDFRRQVTARLRSQEQTLRRELEAGRRRGVAEGAARQLFEEAPSFEVETPPAPGPVEVGQPVRHRGLGWEGTLERLERDRAEVLVHGKRVRCSAQDLLPVAGAASEPRPARGKTTLGVFGDGAPDVRLELNLVGRRVEPALDELDRYLDQALLSSRPEVRIIHGHGSGRLRTAVRNHLRGHHAVSQWRPGGPGEGGEGATVIRLRES